ncbi:hypothetical protein BamIOP4010DRAFT_6621 [Burkholderia ambifaria IOP40-10]|uniref:Uncharacterized protein n=1 Tax=Burkholderia ambifaria IOP40-10 TaxID=396596 RepID=B1FRG0_9BURK|nr:hypothetical protein BamIOP4010DRAFT_6621 [Burkholderia ambifaria IOP40-10]
MQHEHLARAAHGGDRCAGHAGERGIGELVDVHDLRDRQARRIDAVEAARDELVARDEIRARRHEAQIERIALRRAVDHAAQAGAQHLHGNREIAIGDQRDFGLQREHARDLADHAVLADDRRAVLDALLRTLADHDLLRERVARVVLDLDRGRLRRDVLAQFEHRAQMHVFLREHGGLVGLRGQLQVALAQRVVVVAQRRARDGDVGRAHEQVARHERRALQRVQHGAEHAADDFERAEARVRHEERDGEGDEEDEPRERGRTLLEEGRRTVFHGRRRARGDRLNNAQTRKRRGGSF